jgi:hypothetical protein
MVEVEAEEDIYDSELVGTYLYAIDEVFGDGYFMVFDLSNANAPVLLHEEEFEDFGAGDMLVDNDHLYVAGGEGLRIYDIGTDPASPSLLVEHTSVFTVDDGEEEEWEINDYIYKQGDILYANSGLWSFMSIDFSDIYNPEFLDGFTFNWFSVDKFLVTSENIGWMDDGNDLRRIDISDPSNLGVARSDDEDNYIELDGELYDFVHHNDTLYTTSWTSGPQYVAVYKLSERRLIDQIDIEDSLSMGFSSSIDFHPESRRLVVRGVSDFLEISVAKDGSLTPIKMYDGEGRLNFHGDLLITEGGFGSEGFIFRVSADQTNSTSINEPTTIPSQISLHQNYPNPFNPSTNIKFKLPETDQVVLKVYNMLGKEVRTLVNDQMAAGSYSINFRAAGLPSGNYIYRLKVGEKQFTKKMVLIK